MPVILRDFTPCDHTMHLVAREVNLLLELWKGVGLRINMDRVLHYYGYDTLWLASVN